MPNIVKKILFTHVKQYEGLDRTLDFTASLETSDRMGDQVNANSWKLDNYTKNPVFLWCHDYKLPPIGKAVKTWIENGSLIMRIQFADDTIVYPSGMPSADTVYKLYQGGFMNAVSVGFDPSTGDMRSNSEGGTDYTGQELLELSAVPVPAHPDALRRATEAGLITVKQMEILTPKKKTFSQAEITDEIAYLKTMVEQVGLSNENKTELRRMTGGDIPDKDIKIKCNCEGCDIPKCECVGDKCENKDCECSCHSNKILRSFQATKFLRLFQAKYNENHDPENGQFAEGEGGGSGGSSSEDKPASDKPGNKPEGSGGHKPGHTSDGTPVKPLSVVSGSVRAGTEGMEFPVYSRTDFESLPHPSVDTYKAGDKVFGWKGDGVPVFVGVVSDDAHNTQLARGEISCEGHTRSGKTDFVKPANMVTPFFNFK